ncbi:50S ribosomal protein L32 [Desulfovibrio inopinatus]|uniref:50S ribosomal protein L32 n=1 Tax=Desulfovibrio inopinatus TaxID=102109 RepID=UPI000485AA93|nr:50S ribosomal protein L32 [Desulfovibrio inopinatus]
MAVPNRKISKTRKRKRRANHHVDIPNVIFCECGEPTLPHRICPSCGMYKGRQMLRSNEAE